MSIETLKEPAGREPDAPDLEKKLLELIYNNVADCLFVLSVGPGDEYRFVTANHAFFNVTGLRKDEVIGKRVQDVVPEPAHALVLSKYREALETGRLVQWDESSTYPTGRKVGSVSVTPTSDGTGGRYLVGIVHDITAIYERDKDQQKTAMQRAAILDALPANIALLDADGRILAVNAAWRQFAVENGLQDGDYGVGQNYLDLSERISGDSPHEAAEAAKGVRAVLSGRTRRFELEYPCHSPERKRWFRLTITPLADNENHGAVVMHTDITDRELANMALRDSESRYRDIIDNSPLTFFAVDSNGVITISEGKGLDLSGWPAGALIGTSITDLYDSLKFREAPGRMLSGAEIMRRVFAGETVTGVTEGDGTYFENTLIPIRDAAGRVGGFRGVAINITTRVLAENELRRSEERFRSMIENGSDLISLNDENGVMLYQSPSITRMLGYRQEELIGLNVMDFIHPDFAESTAASVAAIKDAPGVHPPFETRFKHKNGSWIWFECTGTNLLASPIMSSILFNSRDITDRKRAEEALRQSENIYRETVENANDIIFVLSLDGRYISVNRAGEQITGYSRAELRSMTFEEVVAPEYRELAQLKIDSKLDSGGETTYLLEILTKDKRRVTVEVNSRILEKNSEPVAILGIARDISERRSAEELFVQIQEQLAQAQRLESIGLLAGGIAHDFNNLLTAINGYSELILRQIDDRHPLRGNITEIKKAGDRAAELTYQLLAFSRKQILQTRALNINEIVTDVTKMLKRLIGEDIDLVAVLNPDLHYVESDPGQIGQVILNLAVNARDAMPDGGKLTIETDNVSLDASYTSERTSVATGEYVLLAVSDNGYGMDHETQKHIFEPFYTTKEVGKGTGMGLATVYGIVKQSGGYIWAYSEIGRGTTFKIYLPRIAQPRDSAEPTVHEARLSVGTETILLVEDDELVRALAMQILEMSGYTVVIAADGAEALRICGDPEFECDLVITDMAMPNVSGPELATRLADLRPDLKVLFMSGYSGHAIVHQGVIDETKNFIQKPFTPLSFAEKVREVLDSREH